MKQGSAEERRRGRRVPMQASVLLRFLDEQPPSEHAIRNVSLAGVYFETDQPGGLALHTQILASVSIPETERRTFPFTRLAGRGRVVRMDELPAQDGSSPRRYGVALEFGKDLTALTAVPSRG
ncbi:MAG: hypothetical protein A3C53_01920 [Omnitrophica WOR_2 bacterium RIFCSPHIGHO2_02_FULL_68_15]|nr:MAG: hypothetical protein A3C53_01920 [Omnitrophica WOR_2 bacterium RIFCSPHIGHO2_02_FULL_68_15]